jgi:hypothetical protein
MIFSFKLILSLKRLPWILFPNNLIKFSGMRYEAFPNPTQATTHTCTLRRAMKLIILKITKAS